MTNRSSIRQRLTTSLRIAGVITLVSTPLLASAASAHPLGNFTINTSATVIVGQEEVAVDYAIDMAEIPTLQSGADANGDGTFANDELASFAANRCDSLTDALAIAVNGVSTTLAAQSSTATTVAGSADLTTLRIDCRLSSDAQPSGATGSVRVDVDDRYAAEHLGWHEVIIAGNTMTVASGDVLTSSPSEHLTSYPSLDVPLDITFAAADLRSGGPTYDRPSVSSPAVHSFVPGIDSMANRLIGDGTRALTGWSAMLLLGTAAILGALHAFAPGHGKTVMAAYLLGEQGGSVRQAFVLGATVTATHTVGVLALGAMISLTTLSSPDSLYPWLGIASGLLVAGIGANLLRLAFRNRHDGGLVHLGHVHGPGGHTHAGHDHDHHHHHDHDHDHDHEHDHDQGRMKIGSVVAMGFAGGMVPSPSALIVLLGAVALGRTVFGIGLVAAYGLGMAATLVGAGLAFVVLRDRSARLLNGDPGSRVRTLLRYGPLVTAIAVVGGGVLIAARAATEL